MTINEIEQAIRELSSEELARFRAWFEEFDAEVWDEKFGRDAKSGKLTVSKSITEEHLKKLQGSLKGTGALKTLIDDRRRG